MDKLTIDTPEQVHLEFLLAGIGSRFMAVLLDSLLQVAAFFLLFIVGALLIGKPLGLAAANWMIAGGFLAFFCLYWGYFAIFETVWKGQTPGKRWAGIRVIKDSGRPINVFEAIARNLLRAVDSLPGFYAAGVITMLFNKRNRRLGDFVAGTLVVHETSDQESAIFFNTAQSAEIALPQAAQLTMQEAELIEAFLARRLDIPPGVRQQSAQRIADMLAEKLVITAESRPLDNENFLELLVKEFRNRARLR
ncbi:MAG: RDD family protein [Candidatus Angelobacter sp.]